MIHRALVLALAGCAACLTEPPLKTGTDILPAVTGDGWAVADPADEGLDPAALRTAYDAFFSDTAFFNAVSLIVARNGRLVGEGYARGASDREVKRNIQSATKSVTSMVLGIAAGDGWFPDLDRTLYSIIPDVFGADDLRKRDITLRHLLTMRSGIDFPNSSFTRELLQSRPRDQARYILAKPLFAVPGDSFYYRDADPQLLASAVERVTGRQLADIAAQRLFTPLGIEDWYWEANVDGTTLGAVALFLRPRDLAKLGQLALQNGVWNGTQLVPAPWLAEATAPHTASSEPRFPYGYYWWVVPELGAFTALGHGGNFALVVPAQQLLVVLTSLPSADDDDVGTTLEEFLPLARIIVGAAR